MRYGIVLVVLLFGACGNSDAGNNDSGMTADGINDGGNSDDGDTGGGDVDSGDVDSGDVDGEITDGGGDESPIDGGFPDGGGDEFPDDGGDPDDGDSGGDIQLPGELTITSTADPEHFNFSYQEDGWTTVLSGVIFVPADLGPGLQPGVLVSHGSGGSASGFGLNKLRNWFGPAGFVGIAPDYTHTDPQACNAAGDCAGSPENIKRATRCLDILESQQFVDVLGELVDPGKLGAYGNSMGAFVTVELAMQIGSRLRVTAYTAGGLLEPYTPSGVDGVAGIRSPMLMIHGDSDTTVPPALTQMLADALIDLDLEHQLVWFLDAGHGIANQAPASTVVGELVVAWMSSFVFSREPLLESLDPAEGSAGTTVTVQGNRLGDNPASNSRLLFGLVPAELSSWTDSQVVATVPAGAQSGPVRAEVPAGPVDSALIHQPVTGGVRSNSLDFSVLP